MVLEKTLESPLDCKEISPEHSLEGLMLKLKLQYFGHLMRTVDSLEKTLMLGKIEGRRRKGQKQMTWLDVIIYSNHMSEQILGDSEGQGSLVLQSRWSERSGHDLATEQQTN